MSRSDVILQALREQVALRKSAIDGAADLAEVTITVKLQAGTTWLRGTTYSEERIVRSRDNRSGS